MADHRKDLEDKPEADIVEQIEQFKQIELVDLAELIGLEIPPEPLSFHGSKYFLEPNIFYTHEFIPESNTNVKLEANKLFQEITTLLEITGTYKVTNERPNRVVAFIGLNNMQTEQTEQTEQSKQPTKWTNLYKWRNTNEHVELLVSIYFDYMYYKETAKVRFIIELRRTETRGGMTFIEFVRIFRSKLIELKLINNTASEIKNKFKWSEKAKELSEKRAKTVIEAQTRAAETKAIQLAERKVTLDSAPQLCIIVQNFAGDMIEIVISSLATIAELKNKIYNEWRNKMPEAVPNRQKLAILHNDLQLQTEQTAQTAQTEQVNGHTELDDTKTLDSYGIQNHMTIHLLVQDIVPPPQFQLPQINPAVEVNRAIRDAGHGMHDHWDNSFGYLLYCSENPIFHRELLSQNVMGLLSNTFQAQVQNELRYGDFNAELLCHVVTILTNVMKQPESENADEIAFDIAFEARDRARAAGMHIDLLQLIVRTSDPFVLIDAGRALIAFGLENLNTHASQNAEFNQLLTIAVDKYKSHPKQNIQDIWFELSKSLPQ